MEDSNQQLPSGDKEDRNRFGQNLRLAMAFMEGSATPPPSHRPLDAMPTQAPAIAQRLKTLGQDITSNTADQLELLIRFDELEGWRNSGARHCVAWMNLELSISQSLGWEYLRVGRQLRRLYITRALFRAGSLSWSKVRLLSRVANADNEGGLCHAALDASVSEVERLCNEYRWHDESISENENEEAANAENARYLRQFNARSLSWNSASNGNTVIRLALPGELAQAFLQSVEHSLQALELTDETMTQRRADAAVLMAESSLQATGKSVSSADRYQVIVSVDASQLGNDVQVQAQAQAQAQAQETANDRTVSSTDIPAKRPMLPDANPIAQETARRIACDCSVSTVSQLNGEPLSIGRKSRLWAPAMARAIKLRDQHCQFPGCTQTRHLQIHHIKHWADGGTTSVDNGVCLCQAHHVLLHEGGYRVERVDEQKNGLQEQFSRQSAGVENSKDGTNFRNADDVAIGTIEAALRNNRASFDFVRQLSPTRFRFRFVNPYGRDVRDANNVTDDTANSCFKHHMQTASADIDGGASEGTDSKRSVQVHSGDSTCVGQSAHSGEPSEADHSTQSDDSARTRRSQHQDRDREQNQNQNQNQNHSTRVDSIPKTAQDIDRDRPGVEESAGRYEARPCRALDCEDSWVLCT